MAVPTPDERPAGNEGLIEHLRLLAASVAAYLTARLQLAGLESKEASAHYLKILIWLFAGLFGVIFGYIFFCIAIVFLVNYLFHVKWFWIMLGMCAAHFAVAVAAIAVVRSKFSQPMFAATIAEFKKDQIWLNTPRPAAKPN